MSYNTTIFWTSSHVPNLSHLENGMTEMDNFLVQIDSKYLDVNYKMFKGDDNKDFRLLKNLKMEKTDFNQFMRLRNQLAIAAENFGTGENLSPLLIPTMSKDTDD